jgi:hypothetical protein
VPAVLGLVSNILSGYGWPRRVKGEGEGDRSGNQMRRAFQDPYLNPLPLPKERGGKHEDVPALQHFNGAWPVVILPCVIDLFFGRLAAP